MKNFIFAMCGFLMMSLVSLSVQASSVKSPKCEYVNPSVDVGLPDIQFITLETAPADCVVLTMTVLYKSLSKRLPVSDIVSSIVVCQTDAYSSAKLLLRTAETDSH